MHWDALLQEVLNKNKDDEKDACEPRSIDCDKSRRIFLGIEPQHTYFTNREAEVMTQLLQGKTLNAVAKNLKLSPRTVEFYVKNMKNKLACRTKSELIGKVFASDFVKNLDNLPIECVDEEKSS